MMVVKKDSFSFLLLICALALFNNARAQHWQALGTGFNFQTRVMYADTLDNYLYVAGRFYKTDNKAIKGIARWNGFQWDSLASGIDGLANAPNYPPQNTLAITRFQNKLYVGGAFASLGNIPARSIGTWDGNIWDTLSIQPFVTNISNAVGAFAVIDNELYVGGVFETVAGMPSKSLFKWDGTTITPMGLPSILDGAAYVNAICKYDGEIYIGGNFSSPLYPNDTIQDIIRYSNGHWKSVAGGLKGSLSEIASMVVYNGELYIAGSFSLSEGNIGNYIQKWNGTEWSDVGGGVMGSNGTNGQITKLFIYDNKIYAVGVFSYAGGISAEHIATWDGTNWCALGGNFDNVVGEGCFYKDTLYVGGGFWTVDGDSVNYIAKWTGGDYVDTCGNATGISEMKKNISSLTVYPNPANNQITIDYTGILKDVIIEIKSTLGETLYSEKLEMQASKTIDISAYSNGVYFIQIQKSNQILNKKFVKQ